MWKKVLYIGVAVVIGIFVFIINHQSTQYDHIIGIVNDAIAEKNYENVAKVFGGCFDTNTLVEDDCDSFDMIVYPATASVDTKYYPNDVETTYLKYEKAYYIYLFKSNFAYGNTTSSSGETSNQTAFKFYSGDKEYTFTFIANETVNKNDYVEKPATISDIGLRTKRDLTAYQANWNFITLTLTESMVEEMMKVTEGSIDSLAVVDNLGEEVYRVNVKLDFSQEFFTDVDILVQKYSVYLDKYVNGTDDEKESARKDFEYFYEGTDEATGEKIGWKDTTFKAYEETKGYTFRFENDELQPGYLIWKTIGICALYVVVVALIYILLFHFSALKRIFSRETYKDYGDDEVIVNGKRKKLNKEEAISPKEEAAKPEAKEEVEAPVTEEEPKEETTEE